MHSSQLFKQVAIIRPSFPIALLKSTDALFLAICQTAKNTDKEGLKEALVDVQSEFEKNKAFVNQYSLSELSIETSNNNNEDD